MELFKQTSINWLGNRWVFYGISLALLLLGVFSYVLRGGFNYGIDFTGGTIVFVKFQNPPDLNLLRETLKTKDAAAPLIQRFGLQAENTVQVRMQRFGEGGQQMDADREKLTASLRKTFDSENLAGNQTDFNNVGVSALHAYLLQEDPEGLKTQNKTSLETDLHYEALAQTMMNYRNKEADGLVPSLDSLRAGGISNAAIASLKKSYYAGPFAIKGLESIGAIVGSDLRRRAILAVGLSFLGMLVYIGFRFKPIYGVAAIIALFHDVLIALGFFAFTQKEISLTVIAALLTLVGYSVNDTIVIFDRVRENLPLMRKESVFDILNHSINQTLSRTVMTSGFTFLAVFSLFLFGGEVLNGFSFTLTVGIIVGTYSSIAIASPIVEWWDRISGGGKVKRKTA